MAARPLPSAAVTHCFCELKHYGYFAITRDDSCWWCSVFAKKNTTSVKEKEPGSEYSPEKGVLTKLPGDICGHCKGRCTYVQKLGKKVRLFVVYVCVMVLMVIIIIISPHQHAIETCIHMVNFDKANSIQKHFNIQFYALLITIIVWLFSVVRTWSRLIKLRFCEKTKDGWTFLQFLQCNPIHFISLCIFKKYEH